MYFFQLLLNGIVSGTQILLIAVPLYFIYSAGKVFHIGIGAFSTAVAYGFYWVFSQTESVGLATLMALAVGLAFGVISFVLLEPFVRKKQNLFALLASFSMGVAVESLIAIGFGSEGKSIVKGVLPTLHFLGLNLTWTGLLTILMGVIFFLVSTLLVRWTSFGRVLRSLAESATVSESLGTNSRRVRLGAILIAVFLAGFVGILSGANTALTPFMGFHTIILAFVAFLVGGATSLWGTFIASYLVALVPQFVIGYSDFSASWKMVFVFVLAAVLLSVRPKGLLAPSSRQT